jgi:hypothetical protein
VAIERSACKEMGVFRRPSRPACRPGKDGAGGAAGGTDEGGNGMKGHAARRNLPRDGAKWCANLAAPPSVRQPGVRERPSRSPSAQGRWFSRVPDGMAPVRRGTSRRGHSGPGEESKCGRMPSAFFGGSSPISLQRRQIVRRPGRLSEGEKGVRVPGAVPRGGRFT